MTEGNPMYPPKINKKSLFKTFVPTPELYAEYFDALVYVGKVYVCVIASTERKFSIYIEKDEYPGLSCRVFYTRDDAEYYKEYISVTERISPTAIKIWECQVVDFIDFLITLVDKRKLKGEDGKLRAIGSIVYGNSLKTIDIFWASDSELMV